MGDDDHRLRRRWLDGSHLAPSERFRGNLSCLISERLLARFLHRGRAVAARLYFDPSLADYLARLVTGADLVPPELQRVCI